MKNLLLIAIIALSLNAHAQSRPPRSENKLPKKELLKKLQLTEEQLRRIKIIIRRQRLQRLLDRKELNDILTEKQRKLLMQLKVDSLKR